MIELFTVYPTATWSEQHHCLFNT